MSLRSLCNAFARNGGLKIGRTTAPAAKAPVPASSLDPKICAANLKAAVLPLLPKGGAAQGAFITWPGKAAATTPATAGPLKADQRGVSWCAGASPKPGTNETAGICPGKTAAGTPATAGHVKANQGGVLGVSWVAGTRPKVFSKMGSRGTAGTTKAATARLMSTSAKIPTAGGGPVRYVLAVCAVGGGVAAVLIYLSKPEHVDNDDDEEGEELPDSLDWSLLRWFPRVADPMYNNDFCGCCWAVIAVKSIEARFAIQKRESLNLSIQQVIDCAAIEGCYGNNLNQAYNYILGAGLTTEEAYPGPPARDRTFLHALLRGYCKMEGKPVVARIQGFQRINSTEEALMRALQTSAVAVYVNTTRDFEGFNGGYVLEVSDLPPGSEVPGVKHVLLVVGYGKDTDGTLFWKLMNSWGPDWGEGGYVRFRRGCENPHGVAGMFEHPGFRPVILASNSASS